MAASSIRDRVVIECLEGVWETLKGNERCRFRGTVRLTVTSLVHPEQPACTLQQQMEWILPTPTPYLLVEPVQVTEVSLSEEDPEEDLEEEPVIDVDSPKEFIPVPEVESAEESGSGWLVENDDSLGGDGHLELAPMVQAPPPVIEIDSTQSSSEFAVVPDIDLPGPSHDACNVLPSDSSTAGDTDGVSLSDSTSCSTTH